MEVKMLKKFTFAVLSLMLAPTTLFSQENRTANVLEVDDGVYIYQDLGGWQSMFVVDPEGVVITDPINREAAERYLSEVRKITSAPIRYVVYSHHHYDHIEGGEVFQAEGAVFVAHRNAASQLQRLDNPEIVAPEQLVDDRATLFIGNTRVDVHYFGRNHSDNSLVVSVPDRGVIYAADWLPVRELIWRNIFDSYILEWFEGIDRVLVLDWEKLIPGHVRTHNPQGWGTKDDVRLFRQYFSDLREAVRIAHLEGKCPTQATAEVKLPDYEHWFNYESTLPLNVERMCLFWRNGWQ
jgi:glyoxylase-like metal-dependent hydrolase (beta-lactamase superfamily II)